MFQRSQTSKETRPHSPLRKQRQASPGGLAKAGNFDWAAMLKIVFIQQVIVTCPGIPAVCKVFKVLKINDDVCEGASDVGGMSVRVRNPVHE